MCVCVRVLSSCDHGGAGPLVTGGGFKRGSLGEDLSAVCDTATNSANRWRPLGVESSLDDKWLVCVCVCMYVCKIGCQTIFTYH